MRNRLTIVFWLFAVLFLFIILYKSVQAQFLPPSCQYPQRTTNPAGGCDNSEPCDPLDAAKGGSGECHDTDTNVGVKAPAIELPKELPHTGDETTEEPGK